MVCSAPHHRETATSARVVSLLLLGHVCHEGPMSAPSPTGQCLRALLIAQPLRDSQQRAIDHGAIVAGQFDQSGLGDQPAKLDQVTGAFSPLHDPFACVTTRRGGLIAMSRRACPS